MAANKKRALEDATANPKSKKSKTNGSGPKEKAQLEAAVADLPTVATEEVDFRRGGGTSFTPLEVKTIRTEATQEANDELFAVCPQSMTLVRSLTCYSRTLLPFPAQSREAEETEIGRYDCGEAK